MEQTPSLRPITEQDEDFLLTVYASPREDELRATNWDDREKETFLRMQFSAQHQYYQEHYCDAAFDLILLDDEPIGRLYLQRRKDEFRIVDIALLAQYRGKGIGGKMLRDILLEAGTAGLLVRIHVEHNNPAMNLYVRLGFKKVSDHGVYHLMEWMPKGRPAVA